jgi:hypothetical protein
MSARSRLFATVSHARLLLVFVCHGGGITSLPCWWYLTSMSWWWYYLSASLPCVSPALLLSLWLLQGKDSDRVMSTIGDGPPREGVARRAAAEACCRTASRHAGSRPRELRAGYGCSCAAGRHGGSSECAQRRHPAQGDAQVAALARHPGACPHAPVAH